MYEVEMRICEFHKECGVKKCIWNNPYDYISRASDYIPRKVCPKQLYPEVKLVVITKFQWEIYKKGKNKS
jgi:hypothetical protein